MSVYDTTDYIFSDVEDYPKNFTHIYRIDEDPLKWVKRKPIRPGQLYYKDGFKLETGTELCLYHRVQTYPLTIRVQFVQFIRMRQHDGYWKLGVLTEKREAISVFCIGYGMSAIQDNLGKRKLWREDHWVTLKSDVDRRKLEAYERQEDVF